MGSYQYQLPNIFKAFIENSSLLENLEKCYRTQTEAQPQTNPSVEVDEQDKLLRDLAEKYATDYPKLKQILLTKVDNTDTFINVDMNHYIDLIGVLAVVRPLPPDIYVGPLPRARELVRESASFRMGNATAANFDYITKPIQGAYNAAKQALIDASIGASYKQGILILGAANSGKTRLAFEVLTQTLPDWRVLLWNATYDTPSKVPLPTVAHGSGLVVFIDDLQEYMPAQGYDADGLVFLSDNRIATLQAFLHCMQTAEHLVVVATCRLEDETRVGARLRWLFDQLEVIKLGSYRVEVTDPG